MKNAFAITAAAVTLALVVTGPGFAMGGPGGGFLKPERFAEIDANKDGQLSKAELEADRAARFAKADANKDGKLTAEEMKAVADAEHAERMGKGAEKMISHLDEDGDGALTLAEMSASKRGDKMFARIDANNDGQLSKAEVEAAREHRKKHGRGHGKGHDDNGQNDG